MTKLEEVQRKPADLQVALGGLLSTDTEGGFYYRLEHRGQPGFDHEWYVLKYQSASLDQASPSRPLKVWRIVVDDETAEWLADPLIGEAAKWFGSVVAIAKWETD